MVTWQDMANEQEYERDCFRMACTLYKGEMVSVFGYETEFDTGNIVQRGKDKGKHLVARLSDVASKTTWRALIAYLAPTSRSVLRESYKRLADELFAFLTGNSPVKSHDRFHDLPPDKNKLLYRYCLFAVASNLLNEKIPGEVQMAVPYHDLEVLSRYKELLAIRNNMDQQRFKAWGKYRKRIEDGWDEEKAAAYREKFISYAEVASREECMELRERPYMDQIPPSGRPRPLR